MTEPTDITPGETIVEPLMGDDRVIDDVHSWIRYGVERGWVAEPVCNTHDGLPSTPEEAEAWDEGGDPCQAALRLWPEGYLYVEEPDETIEVDDAIEIARLIADVPEQAKSVEGYVKIEIEHEGYTDDQGMAQVRNVVYVDGARREANVQVITSLSGKKVVFLDGEQVKTGEVWQDGVAIAIVPGVEE
jgi:hypothetical protein